MFRSFIKFFSVLMVSIFVSTFFTGCGSSSSDETSVQSLTINSDNDIVVIGESEKFTANALLSDGILVDVSSDATWRSSDESIVTVDNVGNVSGVSEGIAIISATYSGLTSEISVQAYTAVPTFVSARIVGNKYVPVGTTAELDVYATLSDGTEHHANKYASWSSSDTSKATVDTNGVVTGVNAGNVTIKATGKNNPSASATHATVVEGVIDPIDPENPPVTPPESGSTLHEDQFVWAIDLNIDNNIANGVTGANRSSNQSTAVWYYLTKGQGYVEDQTVKGTYLSFNATLGDSTSDVYVNVYLDCAGTKKTLNIFNDDDWEDARASSDAECTIRTNYRENGGGKNYQGNFILRLGSSTFKDAEVPFKVSKFVVTQLQ